MDKLHVVVLSGGNNSEHEVSLSSGREVMENLDKEKYLTDLLIIPKDKVFDANSLLKLHPDFVFIALHGKFGEDGTIQGMLEFLSIPYLGSGVLASALGMDKTIFRKIMMAEKILSPKTAFIQKGKVDNNLIKSLGFPLVVKPARQGSSVGVSLVHSADEINKAVLLAFEYDYDILVEEYIKGTEVSCGILGNDNPKAFPLAEILPKNEFFNYEAKYVSGMCEEIIPARIPDRLTKKVQETAIKVYKIVGCKNFSRVDMIINKDTPYVLEINTIPGLTPNSLLPKEAAVAGISYSQLLDQLIKLALEKD